MKRGETHTPIRKVLQEAIAHGMANDHRRLAKGDKGILELPLHAREQLIPLFIDVKR